jgi:hypothetical protein
LNKLFVKNTKIIIVLMLLKKFSNIFSTEISSQSFGRYKPNFSLSSIHIFLLNCKLNKFGMLYSTVINQE